MTRSSDFHPVLENVNVGIVIKLSQIRKEYNHQVHHSLLVQSGDSDWLASILESVLCWVSTVHVPGLLLMEDLATDTLVHSPGLTTAGSHLICFGLHFWKDFKVGLPFELDYWVELNIHWWYGAHSSAIESKSFVVRRMCSIVLKATPPMSFVWYASTYSYSQKCRLHAHTSCTRTRVYA